MKNNNGGRKQKITPFLWFDNNVDEAIEFYTSIFKNAKVSGISRYGEGGPGSKGTIMTATFNILGQEFIALNGGPHYKFTEAFSFMIHCETQEEVDHYWNKLSAGGVTQQCGWLKDKFGLSWQVIPYALSDLFGDRDPKKSNRVMEAMMKMTKIDIAKLEEAHAS